jgi:hypothetical protein
MPGSIIAQNAVCAHKYNKQHPTTWSLRQQQNLSILDKIPTHHVLPRFVAQESKKLPHGPTDKTKVRQTTLTAFTSGTDKVRNRQSTPTRHRLPSLALADPTKYRPDKVQSTDPTSLGNSGTATTEHQQDHTSECQQDPRETGISGGTFTCSATTNRAPTRENRDKRLHPQRAPKSKSPPRSEVPAGKSDASAPVDNTNKQHGPLVMGPVPIPSRRGHEL